LIEIIIKRENCIANCYANTVEVKYEIENVKHLLASYSNMGIGSVKTYQ
jgi:hypothetical protein